MEVFHPPELNRNRSGYVLGQDGHSILRTLALPDGNDSLGDVDVLHAEPQAFADAQAGSVQHRRDETCGPAHLADHGRDLGAREDFGHTVRSFGADNIVADDECDAEYVEIEKLKSGE